MKFRVIVLVDPFPDDLAKTSYVVFMPIVLGVVGHGATREEAVEDFKKELVACLGNWSIEILADRDRTDKIVEFEA